MDEIDRMVKRGESERQRQQQQSDKVQEDETRRFQRRAERERQQALSPPEEPYQKVTIEDVQKRKKEEESYIEQIKKKREPKLEEQQIPKWSTAELFFIRAGKENIAKYFYKKRTGITLTEYKPPGTREWYGQERTTDLKFGDIDRPSETTIGEQVGFTPSTIHFERGIAYGETAKFYDFLYHREQEAITERIKGSEGLKGRLYEFGRYWYSGLTATNLLYHRQIGEIFFGEKEGKSKRLAESYTLASLELNRTWRETGIYGVVSKPFMPGGLGFIVGTSYLLGGGLGALKTAFPLAGKTAEIGIVGYGGYQAGEKIVSPILKGRYSLAGKRAAQYGLAFPFIIYGYGKGMKTGAIGTAKYMQETGYQPIMFGAGFYSRINPINIIKNAWVRLGAKKIKAEEYIDSDVLAGLKTFPESHPIITFKQFKQTWDPLTGRYVVVHGTAEKFSGNIITTAIPKRASDVYGLYVTPYGRASAYFTRVIETQPYYTEFGFLPKFYKPSFRQFYVKAITHAPSSIRYNIGKFRAWQLKHTGEPTVTITPAHEMMLKMESEGVITPAAKYESMPLHSWLQRFKGYSKYTRIAHRDIPIYEYMVGNGKQMYNAFLQQGQSLLNYVISQSYGIGYQPYLSPYTLGLTSFISSLASSMVSYTSSYGPSYAPSYIPSYFPSYKTSYRRKSHITSYVPSGASSKISSKIPSYTPSYKPSKITSYKPSYQSYKKIIPKPTPFLPYYDEDDIIPSKRLKKKGVEGRWIKPWRGFEWKIPTHEELFI